MKKKLKESKKRQNLSETGMGKEENKKKGERKAGQKGKQGEISDGRAGDR